MDLVLEFGLDATRWLQEVYPAIADAMLIVSDLGSFEVYLALLPLIYWCLDKSVGARVTVLLTISAVLNGLLKHLFQGPRPFWLDDAVGLAQTAGFGVPSGHTQLTATVVFFFAVTYRKSWVWLIAFLWSFTMAFSRVYVGAHFIHDVLLGWVLAILVIAGYLLWQQFGNQRFLNRIFGQRLFAAILAPIVLLVIYGVMLFVLPEAEIASDFPLLYESAEIESLEAMVQLTALLLGVSVGLTFETSRVNMQVAGEWWRRAIRYLLGIILTVVVWQGLGAAFDAITPEDTLWLSLPLRFIRYTILGLFVAYFAPMLFVRTTLATGLSSPEIPFTVKGATLKETKE